jgi:hypothetical protein
MAAQNPGQSEADRAQQEEMESQTELNYDQMMQMLGYEYDDRQTWANQNTDDTLATEATVGTITEEAYILDFTLTSDQSLEPLSTSILLFDTSVTNISGESVARASFGQLDETVKTTGEELTTNEQTAVAKYFAQGPSTPPILTWATVTDASLTTIRGDLDAYYGDYAETRETEAMLSAWSSPAKGLSVSRIWTLANLYNVSATGISYAGLEDGGARYGVVNASSDYNTQIWEEGPIGYGDGELVYLSTIAGFAGFSSDDAYAQALGWVNSRVDSLIDQMLVPDVGNQIVNRTVDQGILKKT